MSNIYKEMVITKKKDMVKVPMTGKHIVCLCLSMFIVFISMLLTFPLEKGFYWFVGINIVNIVVLVCILFHLDTKEIEVYNLKMGITND